MVFISEKIKEVSEKGIVWMPNEVIEQLKLKSGDFVKFCENKGIVVISKFTVNDTIKEFCDKNMMSLPNKIIEKLKLEDGGFVHFLITEKEVSLKKAVFKTFGEE